LEKEKIRAEMRAEMTEMKAKLQMMEMQKQIDDLKAAGYGKADGGAGGQNSTKQPLLITKKEATVDSKDLITIEEEDVVELKVAVRSGFDNVCLNFDASVTLHSSCQWSSRKRSRWKFRQPCLVQ
jgi:hypothetical protein